MPGKLLTTVWIFGSVLAWGMLHSGPGWVPGGLDEGLVLGFVLLPLLWSISDAMHMLWLLGLSAAIGAMPEWSVLPSIREYAHPVMLLMGLRLTLNAGGLRRVLLFLRRSIRSCEGAERWAALFLLICIVSMTWNALARGGAGWELKSGLYEFAVLSSVFILAVSLIARSPPHPWIDTLLDGFSWGMLAQSVVFVVAVTMVFMTPFASGNDTVLGLAYWDRVKGTFDGPDQAGIYLAAGVPLVMLWRERVRGKLVGMLATALVQLAPWLVVATGSRTARLALVLILVGLALHAPHRRKAFALLPSMAAALAVGASFQSPRAMVSNLLYLLDLPSVGLLPDGSDLAGMSLAGRMLADERWGLMAQGFRWMAERPFWQLLLGAGLGVGGYGAREYPSMHNALDLLVETGMLGVAVLLVMLGSILRRLFLRDSGGVSSGASSARYLVGLALVGILIGGFSYEVHMWGVTGVVLVMAWCASRMVDQRDFSVGRADLALDRVASVGRRQQNGVANPT